MSVSRWNYTEECEGQPCCGDCDSCSIEYDDEEEFEELRKEQRCD